MIEIYKMTSEKYDPKATDFMKWRKDYTTRSKGRGNSHMLFVQRPRLDVRKYSFTMRSANIWNSLPDEVVCAKTINTFKNRLDKHWRDQDILYNYKSAIAIKTGSNKSDQQEESGEEDPEGTCAGNHP